MEKIRRLCGELLRRNRSHSLAADRLLQGFNRGQIAPKCVFPTDYALKPEKGCWLSGGKVNNYITTVRDKPLPYTSSIAFLVSNAIFSASFVWITRTFTSLFGVLISRILPPGAAFLFVSISMPSLISP